MQTIKSNLDYQKIDWMHPSWRDLVIDHLALHHSKRVLFLKNCGVSGFLLALSSAGGASGKREKPLLQTPKDWQALSESLSRVLTGNHFERWRVLTAILSAIKDSLKGNQTISISTELGRLGVETLDFLRRTWSLGKHYGYVEELGLFYAISEKISPLPFGIELQKIWTEAMESAWKEMESFDSGEIEAELDKIFQWMQMVCIISRNEPRFLRQVAFPQNFLLHIKDFVIRLKERADLRFDMETDVGCEEEAGRMSVIIRLAEMIKECFDKLQKEADVLYSVARNNKWRVEELADELKEAEYDSESKKPTKITSIGKKDFLNRELNIEELFADL